MRTYALTIQTLVLMVVGFRWPCPLLLADGGMSRPELLLPIGYEIGSVGSGDRVLGKFVLRNTSGQELVLRNVRRNCACYRVAHSVNRLQPGESTTLTFELTFPEGKRLRNAVFYILSNDREKPLRQFVVKLSQSDDPDFAVWKPNEVILHLLDDSPDDEATVKAFSRKQGALRVEKLWGASGQTKYAAEFPDRTDITGVAKAYAAHPSVGLVLLRTTSEAALQGHKPRPGAIPHSVFASLRSLRLCVRTSSSRALGLSVAGSA